MAEHEHGYQHENENIQDQIDEITLESPYIANAQPAHGWVESPISRAELARSRNWFDSNNIFNNNFIASEMEGMKNFP